MCILGLDISTSCTGYSIISLDGNLVDQGYIRFKNSQDVFSRALEVKNYISDLHKEHRFTHIFVEQNLQAFRSGFSSAKTLVSLARFNGMVSFSACEVTGIIPEFLNVNTARKQVGLKVIKSEKTTKEQVLDWVSNQLSCVNFSWPTKTLKSGPRKGQTILDPGCFDIADAYVIAKAGYNINFIEK